MATDSESEDARFLQLQTDAKNLASNGKIAESIKLFQEAYAINPTKKVKRRIEKLQAFLEEYGEEIDESMVEVDDKFYLYHDLYKKLYSYQKEGVKWLWSLFKNKKGGVLGDDMGLGKTIQIIAFLSGLFDMDAVKFVLIIMPVSLLPNWEKEFKKWTPGLSTYCFHSNSKRERERMLIKTQNRGGVLLTSYGMIVNNIDLLTTKDGREFVWDYVILDEAHKIKNPTKTTKAVHSISARNRIALTGTPIQNNLGELWSLYDFVQQGTLLGSRQTFKRQYETPISRSREKDATVGERKLGTEIAENLINLIQPYFLRRTKQEVLHQKEDAAVNLRKQFYISRKNDLIIWLYLSQKQVTIYKDFLELDRVKNILMTKRSPLVELTVLKKICDHPRLLSKKACMQLGLDGDVPDDIDDELDEDTAYTVSVENVTDEDLIEESGKLTFLFHLLSDLKEGGHRTLLFSQSRKMLDIIHRILVNRNWKVMRIDGTINKIEEREKRIQLFQEDLSIPIFLLTTQVGGVGFTLTGADRVIIYDPSWNPATDAQAVDRAYRIGQDKNVVIYRLITCSTVEEKIYRRQIFKDSITRQATGGNKDPYRYFTKQELRELFSLENPYHSSTQVQLAEMHGDQRKSDVSLDSHIAFLYSLNIFGISDHDLMFSGEQIDGTENIGDDEMVDDYIRKRVETAQHLLSVESARTLEDNVKGNLYARPYTLPIHTARNDTTKDNYKPPTFPNVIDLTDVNKSLEHLRFQENTVSICDSSITPYKKDEHAIDLDSPMKISVELKGMGNDSVETRRNADEFIMIPDEDDDNQENGTSFVPASAMETSVQRRPRKSLLYVPESDDEMTVNSDASGELFVADSEDSHGSNEGSLGTNKSSSPFPEQNNECRDKQIHYSAFQETLNNLEIRNTDDCMSLPLQKKPISLVTNDNAEISNVRNNDKLAKYTNTDHSNMEVPVASLSTDHNDDSLIELPDILPTPTECEKTSNADYIPCTSLLENQATTMGYGSSSKLDKHDYFKEENQYPISKLFTPTKGEFSPVSLKRITPLKIAQLETFSPESSPFQRALLQSVELCPATSSPLNAASTQKYICNSAENNTVPLKTIGINCPLSFNASENEMSQQNISMCEEASFIDSNSGYEITSDFSDKTAEMSENNSLVRKLSREFEQVSKCESEYSPLRRIRRPCKTITDSFEESS